MVCDRHPILAEAQRHLPELTLRPALAEMRSLRWVKRDEELQNMRALASLTDWVQDRYRENIRPSRLIQELDHAMAALMVEEAVMRFPGEDFEILKCWTLTGAASASPHGDGASCGARIAKGDTRQEWDDQKMRCQTRSSENSSSITSEKLLTGCQLLNSEYARPHLVGR